MKTLSLNWKEQEVQGQALKTADGLWLHLQGQTYFLEKKNTRNKKQEGLVENPEQIVSPMPGKVIKVLCQDGEVVKDGQTVVVIEAMKMEYALKARAAGVVTKLNCSLHQQVVLGQLLVQLKVNKDGKNV